LFRCFDNLRPRAALTAETSCAKVYAPRQWRWRLTSDACHYTLMIKSIKHRGLKRLYERGDRSGIRPDLIDTVERILTVLDAATTPQALDIPRYRLHPLKGDFRGFWS
jgi:toxin HigB-1